MLKRVQMAGIIPNFKNLHEILKPFTFLENNKKKRGGVII